MIQNGFEQTCVLTSDWVQAKVFSLAATGTMAFFFFFKRQSFQNQFHIPGLSETWTDLHRWPVWSHFYILLSLLSHSTSAVKENSAILFVLWSSRNVRWATELHLTIHRHGKATNNYVSDWLNSCCMFSSVDRIKCWNLHFCKPQICSNFDMSCTIFTSLQHISYHVPITCKWGVTTDD